MTTLTGPWFVMASRRGAVLEPRLVHDAIPGTPRMGFTSREAARAWVADRFGPGSTSTRQSAAAGWQFYAVNPDDPFSFDPTEGTDA